MSKKRTNLKDSCMEISLLLIVISFWGVIISGIAGDQSVFAPYSMFIYMISTTVFIYNAVDMDGKWAILRTIAGMLITWSFAIIPYILILLCKGLI